MEKTYQLARLYAAIDSAEAGDGDTLTLPTEAVELLADLAERIALQLESRVCLMGARPWTPTITAGDAFHAIALGERYDSITAASYAASQFIESHPEILNLPDPFTGNTDSQAA